LCPGAGTGSKGGFQKIQAMFCLHYKFQIEQVFAWLRFWLWKFPTALENIQNNKWPGREIESNSNSIKGFKSHLKPQLQSLRSCHQNPEIKYFAFGLEVRQWGRSFEVLSFVCRLAEGHMILV
jgi:hypothetical protein